MILFDRDLSKATSLASEIGAQAASDLSETLRGVDAVLLAIKPKDLESLSREMQPYLSKQILVISILAGIKVEALKSLFPKQTILRTMPNLAVTCEKGVIGIVETSDMDPKLHQQIEDLFEGMGLVIFLPETKVDALTALTASAPAFIFHLVEAMTEGGIFLGFPAELSLDLVLQVFEGALALLRQTNEHPAVLKWKVA